MAEKMRIYKQLKKSQIAEARKITRVKITTFTVFHFILFVFLLTFQFLFVNFCNFLGPRDPYDRKVESPHLLFRVFEPSTLLISNPGGDLYNSENLVTQSAKLVSKILICSRWWRNFSIN